MDEFVAAVARARDRVLEFARTPNVYDESVAYAEQDVRLSEAAIVAPCVLRFVSAEMRPPAEGKPVGRWSGLAPRPIGIYIRGADEQEDVIASRARGLAVDAIAHGYFAMVEGEALGQLRPGPGITLVEGRTAEDLSPYWVTTMSTASLLKTSNDPQAVDEVAALCGANLSHGLQQLRLAGWRRGRMVRTGAFYGEAGMLLRMLQTDRFDPGSRAELLTRTNLWPFEQMPVE